MNYFISRDGQEYGPYTLADLQRYVAAGSILVTDLTRSEGMTEWVPVSQVIGNIPVPVVAVHPAEPGVWREGNKLVVIRGAVLPPFCVKCAQPGVEPAWEKNFAWGNPWWALFLLLGIIGIIVYAIVYYSSRKQMKLIVPLCEQHRRAQRTMRWVGVTLLLTSPVLLVIGVTLNKDYLTGAGVIALLVMAIAGGVVLILASPLRARKIDDQQGWFVGAREPFLQIIETQGHLATGTGL
ncbi:MAG TPA: DUF4339 domain-containing protein [Terriglobales bacterium]|jgi:hypothetical protein|nr:DUF4339 domain-containing protein [Terriglobales bacterium]